MSKAAPGRGSLSPVFGGVGITAQRQAPAPLGALPPVGSSSTGPHALGKVDITRDLGVPAPPLPGRVPLAEEWVWLQASSKAAGTAQPRLAVEELQAGGAAWQKGREWPTSGSGTGTALGPDLPFG